jgi:type 1 glutamine amidotransferase/mono/diheme cytochrome c family protein
MSATRLALLLLLFTLAPRLSSAAEAPKPKKIVFIAGPKSHGPEGNRIHDYPWSAKLLKAMFEKSNVQKQIASVVVRDGWPADESVLADADAVMVISDGRDGDLFQEAPFLESPERVAAVQKLIDRGCGLLTFHFSTFAPDQYAPQVLDWTGGYFDWEENGQKKWYSAIETQDTDVLPVNTDHPVLTGVKPFHMKEEFYFNLRFAADADKVEGKTSAPLKLNHGITTPLLVVPSLRGRDALGQTVGWARERANGGRGFGTTCGHFYDNWQNDGFRKFVMNAIVWATHGDVPAGGVESPFLSRREICDVLGESFNAALAGEESPGAATPGPDPIRVLMFAGNEAHKWHNWEKTTAAIQSLLEVDPRIHVDVSYDIEDLSKRLLSADGQRQYDVIVQNYVNWQDATPLSEASRDAFTQFLKGGGGLALVHFANGAWHFSLPMAGESDWPEYRKIVRRVWNHQGPEAERSSHDAFGAFDVQPTAAVSEITAGLKPFRVNDELYFSQQGDEPIEPLITAESKITHKAEPLAWTYSYGEGRVFQTLLGHSEKTYETFEPREMLRRAVAWAARKEIRPLTPQTDMALPRKVSTQPLVAGKFGTALNAHATGVFVKADGALRRAPITLDAWVKLDGSANFNIIAASEEKSSPEHWELYTYAGNGELSVYLPGHGGEFKSGAAICDRQWHHVAMVLEPTRLQLFVDQKSVLEREVTPGFVTKPQDWPETLLAIGRLVEDGLGCAGSIDEVRIRSGATTDFGDANAAPAASEGTQSLWRFNAIQEGGVFPDETKRHPATLSRPEIAVTAAPQAPPAAAPKKEINHWGKELVGFDWHESDSVDDRWQQTEVGTFLASIIPIDGEMTEKGLTIKVGEGANAGSVCYDTARGQMRAAWLDGFLKFHPARYGLIQSPAPQGDMVFADGKHFGLAAPGVDADQQQFHYRGLWRNGVRTVLEWEVGETRVRETPWMETLDGLRVITRTIETGSGDKAVVLQIFDKKTPGWERSESGEVQTLIHRDGDQTLVFSLRSNPAEARLAFMEGTGVAVTFAPRSNPTTVDLLAWRGRNDDVSRLTAALAVRSGPAAIDKLTAPGPEQWPEPIITQGVRGDDDAPYVIDTVTIPFDNPYKALFFVAGHDFLSPDAAMLCTAHGDVWLVTGVSDDMKNLNWKRFATGLFQPLGMVVRKRLTDAPPQAAKPQPSMTSDWDVLVLCRDHIVRLHDLNADNEADYYEVFHEDVATSAGGHDYVTCLESDAVGRLYYLNAKEGLVRVSPDGKHKEIIATGFRNPNGLGVGPNGEMTVAPQEGEWTPASGIFEVHPGSYGGFGGPQVKFGRPLGYDPPICWIPRRQDNSSGGQVWVNSDRWGPLMGKMLHLSFGQCTVQLVLQEYIHGVGQGGTTVLPAIFESGICRGRFSPFDGQLYVSGLRGWTTAATQDGCLQRLRYTGQPVYEPVNVATMNNGLLLTFTQPLNKDSAEDPDNYFAEQWNITYRKEYGSPEFKVSNPKEEGRDPVEIQSATLLDDGHTVFLEMEHVAPVSQLALSYTLQAKDGTNFAQSYAHTIHIVRDAPFDPARITRRPRKGQLSPEEQSRLQRGVAWKFRPIGSSDSNSAADLRMTRLAALTNERGPVAGQPFEAVAEGFLYVPLKQAVAFFDGATPFELLINGEQVLTGNHAPGNPASVAALHKGYNRYRIRAVSEDGQPLSIGLRWKSAAFEEEPVPPDVFHAVIDDADQRSLNATQGRALAITHNCARCHTSLGPKLTGSIERGAPALDGVSARLNSDWLRSWLLDPHSLRASATMPALLTHLDEPARQQAAADLVAHLQTLAGPKTAEAVSVSSDPQSVARGGQLYEDLSCIGCHRFTPAGEEDNWNRLSLAQIGSKFQPGALIEYLKAPGRHFPTSFMPDFRLSEPESLDLAASLLDHGKTELVAPPPAQGDAARGKKLFASFGCGRCHSVGGKLVQENPIALAHIVEESVDRGCLAETVATAKPIPQFHFQELERTQLRAFLAQSPAPESAASESMRLTMALRCNSCHDRDGKRSPRMEILADESDHGLAPEQFPSLTWTGDRLRREWIEAFISGQADVKPRQWLKGRMPSFPAYSKALADGLAAQHGRAAVEPETDREKASPETIEAGRQLVSSTGLDCRQCHGLGNLPPTGDKQTLLAPGINFALVRSRMREDFYHSWMLDPPRFDLNTRMPKLAADGSHTKVTKFYDGDARRQFNAIWAFLQEEGGGESLKEK